MHASHDIIGIAYQKLLPPFNQNHRFYLPPLTHTHYCYRLSRRRAAVPFLLRLCGGSYAFSTPSYLTPTPPFSTSSTTVSLHCGPSHVISQTIGVLADISALSSYLDDLHNHSIDGIISALPPTIDEKYLLVTLFSPW